MSKPRPRKSVLAVVLIIISAVIGFLVGSAVTDKLLEDRPEPAEEGRFRL